MYMMKLFEDKETNSLEKFPFSKNLRHLGDPFQPVIIILFTYLHILRTILILFVRGIASDVLPSFYRNTEYLPISIIGNTKIKLISILRRNIFDVMILFSRTP